MYKYFLAVDHGEENWKIDEITSPQDGIEKMMGGYAPGKWLILKEVRVVALEPEDEASDVAPDEDAY